MNSTTPVPPFDAASEAEGEDAARAKSEREDDETAHEHCDHTWQFSSLEVARMLSPKKPKPGVEVIGELLRLDQYDCVVDGPVFQNALNNAITRLENDIKAASRLLDPSDLAMFLARCMEACHDALDEQEYAPLRQDRWYKGLEFTLRGVLVAPSGEPAPLKMDVETDQGSSTIEGQTLSWSLPEGGSTNKITLMVGAEGPWRKTVCQAHRIARRLLGASQIRSFVPILAFNLESKTLRFLIFHHGGLTASESCRMTEPGELKGVVRVFLALAFWTTSVGAGFVPSCAITEYALPADHLGKNYRLATVDDALYRSPQIRGRATLVSRLRLSRIFSTEGGFFQYRVLTAC